MKFLVLAVLVGIACAAVVPQKAADGPNCGLKKLVRFVRVPVQKSASFGCEMCLDLVQIAEMYAECDESFVQQKLDEDCRSKLQGGTFLDQLCETVVNDIMKALEEDTDADASKVCTKITKKPCKYDVIAAIVAIGMAIVLPIKTQKKSGSGPNCGAKDAPKKSFLLPNKDTSIGCELCLDLVQVAEMYAECDEAYQQQKMEEYCKSKLGNGTFLDKMCEIFVDDLMEELEADTGADPSKVCTKLLGKECKYSS
uniref:Saposin B-type domain-containing protein n=1 Tax=Panagrolaimus sp. JU765 TaxID=591449 RepID=A0AC34QVF5_9BILA